MKFKALIKDTFTEIRNTKNRFLSIFAIIALGTGFFAGIKATCPDMIDTAQNYFMQSNLADVQIKSTMGFSDEDIIELGKLSYIKTAQPAYTADVFVTTEDSTSILRIYSMDTENISNDNYLNIPTVTEGRLPEAANECLMDNGVFTSGKYKLGDTITLSVSADEELSDYIKYDTFTIVGFAQSPQYVSFERGKSNIGNGSVSNFMFIPEQAFAYEVYTDVFIALLPAEGIVFNTDEYTDTVNEYIDKLEDFADTRTEIRYDEVTSEAYKEIEDAEKEIDKAELEAYEKIADGYAQIEAAQAELDEQRQLAYEQLDEAEKTLKTLREALDATKEEISKGYEAAEETMAKYELSEDAQTCFDDLRKYVYTTPQLFEDLNDYEDIYDNVKANEERINEIIEQLKDADEEERKALLEELQGLIGFEVSEEGYTEYLDKAENLRTALEQDGITDITEQNEIITVATTLGYLDYCNENLIGKAEAELEDAEKEFAQQKKDAYAQLNDATRQIINARNELILSEKEAKEEIANARKELEGAKKELDELDTPKWYVFDRSNNPGYSGYAEDAQRIEKIAKVFPVFFILVALLVCLTTMTRMIEEQRTQIGTLKALGYSKGLILFKYLFYSSVAGLSGSIFGMLVGFRLFPYVIFAAYRIMYIMPDIIMTFRWNLALICIVASLICTGAASFGVCYKELYDTPASLMRPKSPKAGKEIFLERIKPLWNKMGFLHKVTARNIFRYKKRVLMTIVGIAGCTALMFTGLGLRYAISAMVDLQYGNVFNYDLLGVYESELGAEEKDEIKFLLENDDIISESVLIGQHSVSVRTEKSQNKREVYMLTLSEKDALDGYVELKTRKGQTPIELSDDGIVIVEKISKLYDIDVGDTLRVYLDDFTYAEVPVTAIAENYAMNYIYITEECYEKYFNESADINAFLANMTDTERQDELSVELLKNDNILALSYTSESGGKFKDLIQSLNYIILVVILCAGILAFVVLYNLANINITERRRELATIKVLGFYNKEVYAYVNRENIVSSLMGIVVGLFLGVPLEKFVIYHAEVDSVMFAPTVPVGYYIASAVMTFAFVLIVNKIISKQLDKIDMVESLKSIE